MKKSTLTLLLASLVPIASNAQRYMGIATGNYSGTNNVYLNPANIAESRQKFSIDLFSLNAGVDNNLGTINSKGIFNALVGSDSISNVLNMNNAGNFSLQAPYAEIRLPGIMVSLNDKHSLALTTRIRGYNQLNDISRDIYRTFQGSAGTNYSSSDRNFNLTANAWSEIGLSYGAVLYEKDAHMIKGGITARYLMGIGYVNMIGNSLDANYDAATNNVTISNTDIEFATNFRNSGDGLANGTDIINNFFGGAGKGFGADLGVVYEYRPNYAKYRYEMDGKKDNYDRTQPTYMFKFSAAVTDIGGMKYTKNNGTLALRNTGTTSTFNGNSLRDSVSDYNSLRQFAANHGITVDSGSAATRVGLPTALVLGVDYNVGNVKNLYANLTYMGNLADRSVVGNSIYSQITLTPRYETRVFTVGVPLTYSFLSSSLKAGLGVRVGGFFLGSDDMLAFVSNNQYGANVYFGASIPINKKRVKDSDGDLVSNKKDKCPNERGVLEMQGCPNPDKDGDGILDKDDKCPEVAGAKTAMGCPDTDLDSLADSEDRCPTEAGSVAMQGCPDRDGDGVVDLDDTCPDVKGLPTFKGCPDTDGDGLADNEDSCPDKAGPIANSGCPDTDNDGIADHLDRCPTVAGTKNNNGCPEVSVEVKKRLAFAATAIQFETGKAVIKKTSFKMLDEIVKILNDYPDYYMTIDGHTDNVGKPDKNMQLSKDRANSVKNYFVGKGISEGRLQTNGYGDTQPVASNKTAAGKAKNRRVAMDLKLKD